MAKKPTQSVSLIRIQGEYFPRSEADYRLLRELHVPVFRISEKTLEVLNALLLKGVRVEIQQWGAVYPELLESFKSSLADSAEQQDVFGFFHEKNWLMIQTDTSDKATRERYVNTTSRFCNRLAEIMGRYGIRTAIELKERKGYQLSRLTFSHDENIVPSFYFGTKEDYNAPLTLDFNLSPNARLRFNKRLLINNEPTFSVVFEDRYGDHWQEVFSRGFPFSMMKAKDCEEAIGFFVDLHNRLTVKHKV